MDISGSNERPTHIGFESQEGDWGLQKGYWAPGWDGGAVDILLRGSIGLSGILQHGRRKILCCFDPLLLSDEVIECGGGLFHLLVKQRVVAGGGGLGARGGEFGGKRLLLCVRL